MRILGLIPARYASSRFPGKPLANIHGKSMIRRVYEQALQCGALHGLAVATDDSRIYDHVVSFDGSVLMTDKEHQTGTDRCAEALIQFEQKGESYDAVINIQGDEPYIHPDQIGLVAALISRPEVPVGTLISPVSDTEQLFNPNIIKVVTDQNLRALYFSRNPVPFLRGVHPDQWAQTFPFFKHIGIYAYKRDTLKQITKLTRTRLEEAESLEQLRWLENNIPVYTDVTSIQSHSVDIPDDIQKLPEDGT